MKVAVYLGSALNCLPEYNALAYGLGEKLAKAGHEIVYGGANVGTMKDLADGAQNAGGKVTGVFPRNFLGTEEVIHSGLEVVRDNLSELIWVEDFAERKKVMEKISGCAVVMPGSYGTLDEMFTYTCNNAIGEHDKKVYVLNYKGFYAPLKELVANIDAGGFLKPEAAGIVNFCDTVDELLERIR